MEGHNRSQLLRQKQLELHGIVNSRKRKLRELYAVTTEDDGLLQYNFQNVDVPPTSAEESRFLDATDILQGRIFHESLLPTRRFLRSDAAKSRSPIRKSPPDSRSIESSRSAIKLQRVASNPRKSRATTPNARTLGSPAHNGLDNVVGQGMQMQEPSSKSSQTDLPADSSALLNNIVEGSFSNATRSRPSVSYAALSPRDLESDRIRSRVQSGPNSPGVDPRQALPISAEDAANLREPLIQGLGSHDGNHRAAVAHLPPQDVQEAHMREGDAARRLKEARLSIHPHSRDPRNEPLSSPGSTIDLHSATTPGVHEASTDTSPENENLRYDLEREDGKGTIRTPPEFRHTPGEIAEKNRHDSILQGQIEASRAQIMRDSPREPDLESSEALDRPASSGNMNDDYRANVQLQSELLTKEANSNAVDDLRENRKLSNAPLPAEIPDSEAEVTPPAVDPMDIDNRAVKDSFDSNSTVEHEGGSATARGGNSSNQPSQQSSSSATPIPPVRRTPSIPAVMEGRTTRIGSGVLRQKSVAEIIGDVPKPGSSSTSARESESTRNSSSRSATPQSPNGRRSLVDKAKAQERSKLSTVIFPGRQTKQAAQDAPRDNDGTPTSADDYFMPLFQSSSVNRGGTQINDLLATAHKTISTANAYFPILENQTSKILKRIYNLQCSGKWALRQPKRSEEVVRPTTHRDVLLQEVKWMRTDFRQERKWKMAAARNMAYACAEWVTSGAEDRKLLVVKAVPPPKKDANEVDTTDASSQIGHPTPDLVASLDSPMEDLDEEPRLNLLETVAPQDIFTLDGDDIVFGLRKSPTTDALLSHLPLYGAPLVVPDSVLPTSTIDPDRFWKRPALPLSKFVEGRIELKDDPPPRKKSRYQYDPEEEDDDRIVFGEQSTKTPILAPVNANVALFNPDHKHTRDRIHSSHQFRPPSEFGMPSQSFYESRSMSQWTWDEDNELKNLVREYSYNWGLISSMLTSKSLFSSGAERRTPWECFERWVQTEGMPADMGRTHYFRMYTNRIDTANKIVLAQAAAAPAQPNANGQVQPAVRRRPTSSIRVDRRRSQKHMSLVEAMRKLAKKRETNQQKQAHAAGMAAMRKANENPNPVNRQMPATTPQDFSRLKLEREEQYKERALLVQQRQEQQRRLLDVQRRNAQNLQAGQPNGGPPRPPTSAAMPPNGVPAPNQNLTVPGQNRPPRPMPPQMAGQTLPNGYRVPAMPTNGVPAAPMQGQLPLPNPTLDVGLVNRAHLISQSQQAMIRQQQGQHPGQSPQMHNSPPRTNGVPQPGFPNQNMMPPSNFNGNGVGTPPANGHVQSPGPGQAGSPRMGQNSMHMANGGTSQVKHLEQQIMQKYPHATQDQVYRLIQENFAKSVQQQQQQRQGMTQSAMNAAAGGPSGNGMSPVNTMAMNAMGAGQGTPQLYAQRLREQQENQQKAQAQQAMRASNAAGTGQPQGPGNSTGNQGQGHAHRSPSNGANGN